MTRMLLTGTGAGTFSLVVKEDSLIMDHMRRIFGTLLLFLHACPRRA